MKTCPQCHGEYADDYVYCMSDGTSLQTLVAEQETIVSAKVASPPATAALSPEMLSICTNCGLHNRKQSKFCKKCGTALASLQSSGENQTAPPVQFPAAKVSPNESPFAARNEFSPLFAAAPPAAAQNSQAETIVFQVPKIGAVSGAAGQNRQFAERSSSLKNWLIGVAAMLLLIGGGYAVWLWTQPNPLEQKLDAAIKNKQIMTPANASAHDFYHQLKVEGASAATLKKYEDKIFPLLTDEIDEILKTVAEPGSAEKRLEEWLDESKKLEWASALRPDDKKLAAQTAYCKGRAAYLQNDKNAAIEDWKRAAELDAKWALPLNGIGLIYNEKKDYQSAREWLAKAIEREPDWAIPYNNYGTSYFYQNRFDEAAAYYRQAAEKAPLWARPHAWLASVAEKRFDYQTAVAEYEQVFAPNAIGAQGMDLESLRRRYEKAKANSYSNFYSY